MFDSIKPEFKVNGKTNYRPPKPPRPGKKVPWGPIIIVVAIPVLIFLVFIPSFSWLKGAYKNWRAPQATSENSATNTPRLINNLPVEETLPTSTEPGFNEKVKIEYLSFNDFYQAPAADFSFSPASYKLPLNVKTEVLNYYEVSRALNLDPALKSLNTQGLALIDNPWAKESEDFYGLYSRLIQGKMPLLITTDFLTYYYQNNLKQIYKNIEKNVFYSSLWDINKELYLVAKNRYEERLAKVGNVNDTLLESERLELAYLAVALELLKPTPAQINKDKNLAQADKFSPEEQEYFAFPLPSYLEADVSRELKLIREAKISKTPTKSPVLLYPRNYADFNIPAEYKPDARLGNFYLSLRWLNSPWPLNYKNDSCPDCLLDYDDWRLNLTAASLLAKDFSANPLLKQRWARIYKIIYYFKGLRDDFNYVYYRDTLASLFGETYNPEILFDEANPEATANLEKFRARLLTAKFLDISGGSDLAAAKPSPTTGLKILSDFYWPNDYIFKQLTYPSVGAYLGQPKSNNLTACRLAGGTKRCNGFAFDPIGLIYEGASTNAYWSENINFDNYDNNLATLKNNLAASQVWHNNNYWSTLSYLKSGLNMSAANLPAFGASIAWRDHLLRSAAATWINLQLPLDKLSPQVQDDKSLRVISSASSDAYIEPNLAALNELIASGDMILGMFNALNLSEDANQAILSLESLNSQLKGLNAIVKKELSGETLSSDDDQVILNFSQAAKLDLAGTRQLSLNAQNSSARILKEDLSHLKLLLLVSSEAGRQTLAVGPVWDYKESRQ